MSAPSEDIQSIAKRLSYYKRADVREAMIGFARDKEVAVRYGDRFGKRPDVLIYPNDVLSHAKKKASSFHISEETWMNPSQLSTNLRRADLNDLRTGWDLIIDIDFPIWEVARDIAARFAQQLLDEDVHAAAISAKFSGNKGFHLAVPFEAFPDTYITDDDEEVLTSDLFPEVPKRILSYLLEKIDGPSTGFEFSQLLIERYGEQALREHIFLADSSTGLRATETIDGAEFVCGNCDHRERSKDDFVSCKKCGRLMTKVSEESAPQSVSRRLDLGVDEMLISSRHMYRMPFSLHEKSGLVSVPIDLSLIQSFDRGSATPDSVDASVKFLDRNIDSNAGLGLFQRAMQFTPPQGADEIRKEFSEVKWSGDAAKEELFPPAINQMLAGMEDGRKRALFVLTNFLTSVGWSYEMVEARLLEWNQKHTDPLRENLIISHVRYHKQRNQVILPPNFDNDNYYKDLGITQHDELSKRVKNPVQYVRLKQKQSGSSKKSDK